NQPAPRAHADQRSQAGLAEIIGKGVAARSAPAVDEHHLGTKVGDLRKLPVDAIAHRPERERLTVQELNKTIGNLAAAVEALVDNHSVLIELRGELAHKLGLSVEARARNVHVTHATAAQLIDALAV